ncbi:potassium transporter 10-like [Prunus avium]|uniref:Potassium transporter n=1 Tax=Prunus avium TaxID=42229 RepID=A0A6P5THR5_PRUAV|nr:potassium transporter 10-like [Prunus avium]XP_021826556.1 potassium transporter 10-like [Prunus avium]
MQMARRMSADENTDNKGSVWALDQQLDQPMDEEAKRLRNMYKEKKYSTLMLLQLAFQSLGVVYGDLGTSPLYVFYNTFPDGIGDPEDLIGALSVIIYSLTLIPLLKYVFIVCRANDNGQGGTFALYSLLCRHAKIKAIPNQDQTDEALTTYSRSTFGEQSFAARTKRWLEGHALMQSTLLILVLVGSCMVIGDGILTPAISVLSAVGGINVGHPKISNGVVVLVAVVILVLLFTMQRHGTDKVGWLFAPVVLLWFLVIGGIGMFNIWKYDRSILKAFSPVYVYRFFKRGGKDGWTSLGGIMLSITGTEALFADLSHFPVPSIQIAFTSVVFPCLLLAYCGQAAYLMKNSNNVIGAFYHSIPDSIYWPVFIVATAAAVVASQATITATFSLIKQALALGCFPRVKIVHTSRKYRHQIYIPEINWIVMILCIAVTAGFKNQNQIGNASGTAVCIVMLVTTLLMILVMILVWRCHWILVLIFTGLSLVVEGTYFSAVLLKVNQGGWVPLVIAAAFFVIMYVWHYGTVKRFEIEMHSKVSMAWILGLGPSLGLVRVPGIGLVYSELASGVPRIFSHFITNLPAIHSVVVFVCVKYLPVWTVPEEERFLVKRIGPKNFHMFRCVARYGYKDDHKRDDDFEKKLFQSLFLFFRLESLMEASSDSDVSSLLEQQTKQSEDGLFCNSSNMLHSNVNQSIGSGDSIVPDDSPLHANNITSSIPASNQVGTDDEVEFLNNCRDAGVVHMLGNTVVKARKESKFWKKIAIDYLYAFLRKICRENSVMFNVPHESLLNVGQVLYV